MKGDGSWRKKSDEPPTRPSRNPTPRHQPEGGNWREFEFELITFKGSGPEMNGDGKAHVKVEPHVWRKGERGNKTCRKVSVGAV